MLDRLPLIKYRNVRGCHIYIRPSGEHRFTVLDDLDEAALARLSEDGFDPCAVVETSAGNFQAWLKHSAVLPKLVGTFAAQTLASRYNADPSAADWRRFGRLPGFTNCKPKYRKPDGHFPFVRLKSHSGKQYRMAEAFVDEITRLYEEREQEREAKRASLSPRRGRRISTVSLEQFRTSSKYQDRPAAADIAFCIAAYANGMTEDRIERALEDDFLAPDSSPSTTSCLHSENHGEGEEMDRAIGFGNFIAFSRSSLLGWDDCSSFWTGFCLTRAMREGR